MTYLDEPGAGMTSIHVERGEPMLIEFPDAEDFRQRCPEQFAALVDCTAAVNRIFLGDMSETVVCLVFS